MEKIAILGIGEMGKRMAENYLLAGYKVHVWNRTYKKTEHLVKKGALAFKTPSQAVHDVDVVISMLKDDIVSNDVWLNSNYGAINSLKADVIAIECSTISLNWCKKLSNIFEEKNLSFLDAPVVGSRPQAESKQLIHLVGGRMELLSKVEELLLSNASKVFHVGSAGAGCSMKLVVNGIFSMQVAALSESLSVLDKTGIEKHKAINILNQLPVTSPALQGIGLTIDNNNYAPLFPIELVVKDLSYLNDITPKYKETDSSIQTALNIFEEAKSSGYGQDNIAGVVQLFL